MSHILATYALYNFIFIEQSLQEDVFDKEIQLSIVNIASVSYSVIYYFLKNNQDIYATQKDIKDTNQPKHHSLLLDTLQDIIALDNNINDYIQESEQDFFNVCGKYIYDKSAKLVNTTSLNTKEEELFEWIMLCFEGWSLMESCDYNLGSAMEELEQAELDYKDQLAAVIKAFHS